MAQSSTNLKLPLQSKKFLAFLLVVIGWKILSFWIVVEFGTGLSHYGFLILTTLIVVEGFFAVGYVLGQAALDKYTQLSETAINNVDADSRIERLEQELGRAKQALRKQGVKQSQ